MRHGLRSASVSTRRPICCDDGMSAEHVGSRKCGKPYRSGIHVGRSFSQSSRGRLPLQLLALVLFLNHTASVFPLFSRSSLVWLGRTLARGCHPIGVVGASHVARRAQDADASTWQRIAEDCCLGSSWPAVLYSQDFRLCASVRWASRWGDVGLRRAVVRDRARS